MDTWQLLPLSYDEAVKVQEGWAPVLAIGGPPALLAYRPDVAAWRWHTRLQSVETGHEGGPDLWAEFEIVEPGADDFPEIALTPASPIRPSAVEQHRVHVLKVAEGNLVVTAWRFGWGRERPWRQAPVLATKPWVVTR
jgi:hypothetical protein